MQSIDFTKLLGFDAVSDRISGNVDFQDQAISTTLGAKVGPIEPSDPMLAPAPEGIDFQDEVISAKLGAKVGQGETVEPAKTAGWSSGSSAG
jgi:hypothetical protein